MIALQTAEQSLRDGDPLLALQQLQEQVRASPADARLRIFLFQLLAVLGQDRPDGAPGAAAGQLGDVAVGQDLAGRDALHGVEHEPGVRRGLAAPPTPDGEPG